MPTSDTAEKCHDIGEQMRLLAILAAELGDRTNGWSSTLAPAHGRPVLEVVSLATRRSVRVVAEAGSLWWWPQVVEISSVSDVPDAATRVTAVLGGHPAADLSQSADRRERAPSGGSGDGVGGHGVHGRPVSPTGPRDPS